MRFRLIGMAVVFLLASAPAWADGFLSPFAGSNVGGDAGACPSVTSCDSTHTTYGAAVGFMGGGVIGLEEDLSYAPNFFGKSPTFGDNSVLTAMTNLIVGVPIGPVRPYVSGGLGLIRTSVKLTSSSLVSLDNSTLGYDFGGGAMAFFATHVGIRGDYRYLRSAQDIAFAGFSVAGKTLNFSRASVGVVFKF